MHDSSHMNKTKKKIKNRLRKSSKMKSLKNVEQESPKVKTQTFNECGKWYNEINYYDQENLKINNDEIQNLKKQALAIYNETLVLNNSKVPKSLSNSDYAWVKTVMSKGTKTDKVAAYTLLIQDSPLTNLNLLKNMIEMVKVGKNKECFMAIDTLCELFLNDLLPPDRKLRKFVEQPLSKLDELTSGNVISRKRRLLLWYFEEQLKLAYEDFINYVNKIAHDSVDANKEKVITTMSKLLEGNPERENVLLNNIVNKLGDPSHKVGSKVIYSLTKLLEKHPNMREVIIDAVEKVIFRTNISRRAQYYSICFLSQFYLFNGDEKIAKKLISIYLSLFKACIKTGDVDSRMMSALLTGVNRAFPYAKDEMGMLKDHIDTIYKVIHLSHSNIAIQALSLIHLISDYSNAFIDRFYSVLYKKVSEPDMYKSSHHAMLLSLIFKALKKDNERTRVCAFIKRLLQVCTYIPIPVTCGVLIMISELLKFKKDILVRESIPVDNVLIKLEEDNDDGEEHYEDIKEEITSNEIPEEITETKVEIDNVKSIYNAVVFKTEDMKVWSNPDKSVENAKDAEIQNYNPLVRNPLYAGGDKSIAYELFVLSKHFHPTISLFAKKIINGEKIIYSGDPLIDFTLIRFLDKFSFKNPKTPKTDEEKSITFSKFGRKKFYTSATIRRLRVNTADYLNHSEKNIPEDEIFLYRYMKEKMGKEPISKKEDTSDLESVGSDEFDEMLSGLADGGKDDINFLSEVGQLPKKPKANAKETKESDIESGDEEDYLEGEEDSDLGSLAEDFEGDEVDDFEDDDEMHSSDADDEAELEAHGLKLPNLSKIKETKNRNIKNKSYKNKLFASAEEFSELLEETDFNAGGSEALSNKDRAAMRQLKWESDRDKWIHSQHFRSKGVRRTQARKKKLRKGSGGKKKKF